MGTPSPWDNACQEVPSATLSDVTGSPGLLPSGLVDSMGQLRQIPPLFSRTVSN